MKFSTYFNVDILTEFNRRYDAAVIIQNCFRNYIYFNLDPGDVYPQHTDYFDALYHTPGAT